MFDFYQYILSYEEDYLEKEIARKKINIYVNWKIFCHL